MANTLVLTDAEFTALTAVSGKLRQPKMAPEIVARLRDLDLIERRSWPNGPLWRTTRGDWRVRKGQQQP